MLRLSTDAHRERADSGRDPPLTVPLFLRFFTIVFARIDHARVTQLGDPEKLVHPASD